MGAALPDSATATPAERPPGMHLELVTGDGDLLALATEWDSLLAQMERPSPFLSHAWVTTWRWHFGRKSRLFIVTARSPAGELVGVAPLHIVRRRAFGLVPVRSLEFLGYRGSAVCADHLDFLAPAGAREAVTAALAQEILRRHRDWNVLVFADLAEDSPLPEICRSLGAGHRWRLETGETCYFRALPGSAAELWAELKRDHPKLASNVKYYRKRLEQERAVRFVAPVPEAEMPATLEALARLHASAHGRKGEAGNFEKPEYRAFHETLVRRLAAEPTLYLARLDSDRQPVAILYGFVAGGVLYFYQSGFDAALGSYSVGTVLLAAVFEDAIARLSAREFDFLRGGESYKSRWTSTARRTQSLYGWQRGAMARLDHARHGAGRRLSRLRSALRARGRQA